MSRLRIAVVIPREEYDSFTKLIGRDPEFPKTYDGWLERIAKENKQCRTRGEIINEVTIYSQEFADWCRACGFDPAFIHLGAFAVAKAARQT